MVGVFRTLARNLLVALVAALILGICAGTATQPPPRFLFIALALAAASVIVASHYGNSRVALMASLLVFIVLGVFLGTESVREPREPHHIYHLITAPRDAVAVGRLTEMAAYDHESSQARIALQSVRFASDPTFQSTTGTILLRLKGAWPKDIAPGDLLALRATLQLPNPIHVPGVFDYARELARQDTWVTGYARSPALLQRINADTSSWTRARYLFEHYRTVIGNFFDSHLCAHDAALYRAILLGDRSRLPDETIEGFRASGTLHILAISGMHLSIIAGLLYTITSWLLRRSERIILHCNVRKVSSVITLVIISCYTLLAGGNIPVMRACIMSAVVILAFCSDREKSIFPAIAFGAMLLLSLSPQTLFTASFQLSFAALIAIVSVLPIVKQLLGKSDNPDSPPQRLYKRFRRWLIAALLVSSAAVLGTLPVVVYHFHRFPLAGPIANLILEPLICLWALPCGFLALPFLPLCPQLAELLLHFGSFGLHGAMWFISVFSHVPSTTIWLPPPSPMLVAIYYLLFWLMLARWKFQSTIGRHLALACPFILAGCLILFPLSIPFAPSTRRPVIYILDVGQGSSTIIRDVDGRTILIDAGSSSFRRSNVGERLIAPFLWNIDISRIEYIFLTHPDADHTNGTDFLLTTFRPKALYASTLAGGATSYRKMLELGIDRQIKIEPLAGNTTFNITGVSLLCLANTAANQHTRRNEGLVLQVQIEDLTILFPGDIEEESERRLVEEHVELRSDILLAPHHGSATSSSLPFMQAVNPQAVIVSSGKAGAMNIQATPLAHYTSATNTPLLTTSVLGTIRIVKTAEGGEIQSLDTETKNPLRRQSRWLTRERIAKRDR